MGSGRQANGDRYVTYSDCDKHICTEGGPCKVCRIAELETLLNEYKDAECRAVKNEGEALKENQQLKTLLKHLRTITDKQAEDEGLWFVVTTAPEAYLQQELRRLHSAVEALLPENQHE